MNYEFQFLAEKNLVIVEVHGEATVEGLQQMLLEKLEHPYWVPGMNTLADLRDATLIAIKTSEHQSSRDFMGELFARLGPERVGNGKEASVVATSVDYGIVRQWEAPLPDEFAEFYSVFRSYDEALEWLGVTLP